MEVKLGDYLSAPIRPNEIPPALARAVSDLLIRDDDQIGPGAALVTGLLEFFELERARSFHQALFSAVWEVFRQRTVDGDPEKDFRLKTGTISDGAIPIELYGSSWSFKAFHIDRDALLFSHLYGPVVGFTGGELHLIDIRPYMGRHSLRFDDVFEWSDEPTDGCKPVLRSEHTQSALAEYGRTTGSMGPDQIVFVNNLPDTGVLHGATPVVVTDPESFIREYHRCSVKDLRLC
ncbi:hypothetical protein [Kitasatospora atroaurantiaca]|uniref:hypothetical protein n=1 Tax=Kitasatospora atroaurantiaca TaxID=285545 RepID=UPI0011A727F6|nr:hypothetical protein [Kitasatospora atroaurantiaca]